VGAVASNGLGIAQIWASVRAGISRIRQCSVLGPEGEPIRGGFLNDETLPPLVPVVDQLPLPGLYRRILSLATLAAGGLPPLSARVPLFLGMPIRRTNENDWNAYFPSLIAAQAGLALDINNSVTFSLGRGAALAAMAAAVSSIANGKCEAALVGGIDSHLDLRTLAGLVAERRVLGPGAGDGFIPGEGAAFLLLSAQPTAGGSKAVRVIGAESLIDEAHRYATEPDLGEGLSNALESLRTVCTPEPIATMFAGMNGETFDARRLGVARLRHQDFFVPSVQIEHPADCFGDLGAASGAVLLGLAVEAVSTGQRPGPALIWSASDHGQIGVTALGAQSQP
jgi:3-oxoacyl-[acyl-carrier-protein] synthase-1